MDNGFIMYEEGDRMEFVAICGAISRLDGMRKTHKKHINMTRIGKTRLALHFSHRYAEGDQICQFFGTADEINSIIRGGENVPD